MNDQKCRVLVLPTTRSPKQARRRRARLLQPAQAIGGGRRISPGAQPNRPEAGERLILTLTGMLWIFSVVCDLVYVVEPDTLWMHAAFDATALGLICALILALPAVAEFVSGHSQHTAVTHAPKRAVTHAPHAYWTLIALFAADLMIRKLGGPAVMAATMGLSVVGITIVASMLRDSRPTSTSTLKRAFRHRRALHVVHSVKTPETQSG